MGTRDDEYDYLFKGALGAVQTGKGAVAAGGPPSRCRARRLRVEPGASAGPVQDREAEAAAASRALQASGPSAQR